MISKGSLRIEHLDGLRGLAILAVIFYHAFYRWRDVLPYGIGVDGLPFVNYGWAGVQLFFLISGYVIALTLERCDNLWGFYVRRWSRLFPAMLVGSLIIFFTSPLLSARPDGQPILLSLLPGLTFTEPRWWQFALGPFPILEGVFWSLYVEVKFYLFAGALYFAFGHRGMLRGISLVVALAFVVSVCGECAHDSLLALFGKVLRQCSFEYFGWFGAGAWIYRHQTYGDRNSVVVACVLALLAVATRSHGVASVMLAGILVTGAFLLAMYSSFVQKALRSKLLLLLGFVSYPLYLIHENMMVSMIVQIGQIIPLEWSILVPFPIIICLVGISYVIAKYIEGPLEKLLRSFLLR